MSSLPFPAQREDTLALGDFGRWILKHIDLWFAFAENLGLGINRMQDIILVTGYHRAKSWVNVVFSEGQGDAEVSFGAPPSGDSSVNIERRFAHGDVVLKLGPSGENLPEDQCIFIRGFRVVRILKVWPRLLAQAGPAPDVGGHEPGPEPDNQLEVIGTFTNTNYQDPLHDLSQYIAERAPDCDMVLVHDDDLAYIDGFQIKPRDGLSPDVLIEHLRDSAPEILQVQWDLLPGNESRSGAGMATTKIAMLSRGASSIGHSPAATNEGPVRIGDTQAPSPPTASSELPQMTEPSTFPELSHHKQTPGATSSSPSTSSTGVTDLLAALSKGLALQAEIARSLIDGRVQKDSLYNDGYIARIFGTSGATQYFTRLLQFDERHLQVIIPHGSNAFFITAPAVQNAQPIKISNQPAWLLDYEFRNYGTVVPQRIWSPASDADAQRFDNVLLNMPLFFVCDGFRIGLGLAQAAAGNCEGLLNARDLAPVGNCRTTSVLRLNWPGYDDQNGQIMTEDQTQAHNIVSLEGLAAHVAHAVCKILEIFSGKHCQQPEWRVGGQGGITANDIILIGLIHVTHESWQPILQLNRYI